MLGDSKAGGPEDAKWSYGAICGPCRVLEDLMARGEEDAECSFWAGRGSCWIPQDLTAGGYKIERWMSRRLEIQSTLIPEGLKVGGVVEAE